MLPVIFPIKEKIQPDSLVEVRSFSGSKFVGFAIVICFLPSGSQRISGGFYLNFPSYKVKLTVCGKEPFITFINPECLYHYGTEDLISHSPESVAFRRSLHYFNENSSISARVHLFKLNTVRCSCCGKISSEEDFVIYQYDDKSHIHIGKCKECFKI